MATTRRPSPTAGIVSVVVFRWPGVSHLGRPNSVVSNAQGDWPLGWYLKEQKERIPQSRNKFSK
jgi:hypothetical protein